MQKPAETIKCIPCNVYVLDGLVCCVLFFLDRENNIFLCMMHEPEQITTTGWS